MGLRVVLRQPEWGWEPLYEPHVACDHCGEPITNGRAANVNWFIKDFGGEPTTGELFFLHKGECQFAWDDEHFERGNWAGKAAFKALDHFLVYVANNTSVDVAKTYKDMGLPDLEVPRSLSPIERPFLEAWNKGVKRGWPALARQHQVMAGERRYRLDFAIPSERIAIELDGQRWHSSPEQVASDRERQAALEALGWHVVRFSGQEVYEDVDRCVARVRDLLASISTSGCNRREVGP